MNGPSVALASVLSAFSLSLLFPQSLASSSSISCFFCVLTDRLPFVACLALLHLSYSPRVPPSIVSCVPPTFPSHPPSPLTSLLFSYLNHPFLFTILSIILSSLSTSHRCRRLLSSLPSMRFMPRSPTRISRFSTLDTFLFSHGRRRHGGRRPY